MMRAVRSEDGSPSCGSPSLEEGMAEVMRTGSNCCNCLGSEVLRVLPKMESATDVRDPAGRE